MTTDEKLDYIIKALNKQDADSKTIGQLDLYVPAALEDEAYVAIYNSTTNKTLKYKLADFLAYINDDVNLDHTHDIEDITALAPKLAYDIEDANGFPWRVFKNSLLTTQDYSSFQLKDKIEGWADGATQKHWVEGIILDDSIVIPDDLDDEAKLFKTNEKILPW